jgi:hypothetical protein
MSLLFISWFQILKKDNGADLTVAEPVLFNKGIAC